MINQKLLFELEYECRMQFPKEACGFILKSGNFIPCKNVSTSSENHFEISTLDFYKYKDQISYIFHSHTKKQFLHICTPSLKDIESQSLLKIPFLIAGFDGNVFYNPIRLPSLPSQEYLNRPYIYGIQDCGTLLRDYYKYTFGIEIVLDPKWSLTDKRNWNKAIINCLKVNNFQEMDLYKTMPQHGDVFVVSIGGAIGNHGIIYIDSTHFLNQNEVSAFEPFEYWSDKVNSIWRHINLCC